MKVEGGGGEKKTRRILVGNPYWETKARGIESRFLKLRVGGNSAELRTVVDIRIRPQCCV